jgi:hypothetical protein
MTFTLSAGEAAELLAMLGMVETIDAEWAVGHAASFGIWRGTTTTAMNKRGYFVQVDCAGGLPVHCDSRRSQG